MAKLFGAQALVLQAIDAAPKGAAGYCTDAQIAADTRVSLKDVQDYIDNLEDEGYVNVARTTEGLSASITAKGSIQLSSIKTPAELGNPTGTQAAESPPVISAGTGSRMNVRISRLPER